MLAKASLTLLVFRFLHGPRLITATEQAQPWITDNIFNGSYVSVNSKRDHPPPGNPRAFDPCSAPHSGAFDANRSPTHRAFDPSKKCWSSVARKKDFVLHVTSHNSSWFSTTYMLIYAISSVLKRFGNNCHYGRFGIFRRT